MSSSSGRAFQARGPWCGKLGLTLGKRRPRGYFSASSISLGWEIFLAEALPMSVTV